MSRPVMSALAAVVLASCSFSPSGGAGPADDADVVDGPAPDGAIDAPIDAAQPDAHIDAPTDAGIDACADVCDPQTGVISSCGQVVTTCAAGCTSMDSPSGTGVHCKQLVPSNGVVATDVTGADIDLVLAAAAVYTFNTETGEIRQYPNPPSGGGQLVRAAGAGLDATTHIRFRSTAPAGGVPGLAIWGFQRLTVPATTVLRPIAGATNRAPVLVSWLATLVAGEIDVGAGRDQTSTGALNEEVAGPGGGRGATDTTVGNAASGCGPGGNGTRVVAAGTRDTGGAGGGFGTTGGRGGPASVTDDGGGVPASMLATTCMQTNLVPLRGGGAGGAGAQGNNGGGGGGALQLTSFGSITIAAGTLYAGGAGGDGSGGTDGGGGGGAGGGLLLEAPAVTITGGSITATGGAGGAGGGNTLVSQYGQRSGIAAMPLGNGGSGATGGGAGESPAEDGDGDVDGTGGGGGGAGVIHLRSIAPAVISGGPVIRPAAGTSTATSQ